MKLKNEILLVCLFVSLLSYSSLGQDRHQLKEEMHKVQYQSTLVLLEWSLLNVGASPFLSKDIFTPFSSYDYFNQANFNWNLINIGIVGFNYYSLRRMRQKSWSIKDLEKRKKRTQRALAINIGLDFLYISYGFFLKQRQESSEFNYPSYQGNGNSLILQGSFLLIFDSVFLTRFKKIKLSQIE